MPTHVIVLAAGQGKRMMSELPKVAHTAAGKPLISWVLDAVAPNSSENTVVVLGHGAPVVRPILEDDILVAIQDEQLGTGHATRIGLSRLGELDPDDTVVVLNGDMPLLSRDLVSRLANRNSGTAAMIVTTVIDDPGGYGRIIRQDGTVVGIVEDRDCSADQREINEINAGVYGFRAQDLMAALEKVDRDNAQGEFYLTDVIGILASEGARLEAVTVEEEEVIGINSQDQLADARMKLQQRINRGHLEAGVKMIDPTRTYIDEGVVIAPGAVIYPGVHLEGATVVGADAQIGPDVFAVDTTVGESSVVWYSVLRSADIGANCEVGPYASLRPGTVLKDSSKAGTFVEAKNTVIGEGSKAPHLTYLGDATIGKKVNIGAGTITCNFDGYEKHQTVIGDEAFIGSDTMLVAPVTIGDRAITGAGSAITRDVEADALSVERSDQKTIPGYARRRAERQAAKKSEEA